MRQVSQRGASRRGRGGTVRLLRRTARPAHRPALPGTRARQRRRDHRDTGCTGRGSFTLAYLGDNPQGEASRVDGSYAAFGRIHNEVLGTAARHVSGRRGIANAYGSLGVNVQCEYLISGPAMGTGVCLFSGGAKYPLHFG